MKSTKKLEHRIRVLELRSELNSLHNLYSLSSLFKCNSEKDKLLMEIIQKGQEINEAIMKIEVRGY